MGNVTNNGRNMISTLEGRNYGDELTKYVISDVESIVQSIEKIEPDIDAVQEAVNDKIREIAEREERLRKEREKELAESE